MIYLTLSVLNQLTTAQHLHVQMYKSRLAFYTVSYISYEKITDDEKPSGRTATTHYYYYYYYCNMGIKCITVTRIIFGRENVFVIHFVQKLKSLIFLEISLEKHLLIWQVSKYFEQNEY